MTTQEYISNTNGWDTLDLHAAMRLIGTLRNDPKWLSSELHEPSERGKLWLDKIFNRLQDEDVKRLRIQILGHA